MKDFETEINKVRTILNKEEINKLIDLLLILKSEAYTKNIVKKQETISAYFEEKTYIEIFSNKGKGKIKIQSIMLPPYEVMNNIPILKEQYFLSKGWYEVIVKEGKVLDYHIYANVHPVLHFNNKSNYDLKIGDTFYIKDEEFILIADSLAFKLKPIGKFSEPHSEDMYEWFNEFIMKNF